MRSWLTCSFGSTVESQDAIWMMTIAADIERLSRHSCLPTHRSKFILYLRDVYRRIILCTRPWHWECANQCRHNIMQCFLFLAHNNYLICWVRIFIKYLYVDIKPARWWWLWWKSNKYIYGLHTHSLETRLSVIQGHNFWHQSTDHALWLGLFIHSAWLYRHNNNYLSHCYSISWDRF